MTTREDAKELMRKVTLKRQAVMARIAELFDPVGLLEPIKLQLKLYLSRLNDKDWKETLSPEEQEFWCEKLAEFVDLPKIRVPRCVIPAGFDKQDIRLVCFADAATVAGGVAVYAGVEIALGVYSSALVAAKSRLMKGTVPRNELSAIMLMIELAIVVKRALGDRVKEVVYVSDSMIVQSLCFSLEKKLHLLVQNRVATILRMVQWTLNLEDGDPLPLYHIEGEINKHDLLTKEHSIGAQDVSEGSLWQTGPLWLLKPVSQMPMKKYDQIFLR